MHVGEMCVGGRGGKFVWGEIMCVCWGGGENVGGWGG